MQQNSKASITRRQGGAPRPSRDSAKHAPVGSAPRHALFGTGLLLVGLACNNSSTQGSVPAASTPTGVAQAPTNQPPPQPPVTIQQQHQQQHQQNAAAPNSVASLAQAGEGAAVSVTARFFGWKGPCQTDPPSRSAWQLADSADSGAPCIYVDGPMPPGFSPAGNGGSFVQVRGVIRNYDGLRYLQGQSARPSAP